MRVYHHCSICDRTVNGKDVDMIYDRFHSNLKVRNIDHGGKIIDRVVALTFPKGPSWSPIVSRERSGLYCHGLWLCPTDPKDPRGRGFKGGLRHTGYHSGESLPPDYFKWHEPIKMIRTTVDFPTNYYVFGGMSAVIGLSAMIAFIYMLGGVYANQIYIGGSFVIFIAGLASILYGYNILNKRIKDAIEVEKAYGSKKVQDGTEYYKELSYGWIEDIDLKDKVLSKHKITEALSECIKFGVISFIFGMIGVSGIMFILQSQEIILTSLFLVLIAIGFTPILISIINILKKIDDDNKIKYFMSMVLGLALASLIIGYLFLIESIL